MIENLVRNRLIDLVSGGVHIGLAPAGTPTPYLRVFLVSGKRNWTMRGPSGARRASIQVDCWADTPKVAAETIEAVLDLVSRPGDDFSCDGAQDVTSDDDAAVTGRHRASMEFFLTS